STSTDKKTTTSETTPTPSSSNSGVSRKISDEILSTVGDELGTSKLNVIEEGKSSGLSSDFSGLNLAINAITNAKGKTIIEEIQRTIEKKLLIKLDITKNLVTYRVEDPITNNAIFRSKIYLTFTAPEDLTNVNIIEVIPKDITMYASTITFPNEQPQILEEDPVVQWHFDYLAAGETKELSYIVRKRVTEITSTTIGTAQTKKLETQSKPLDLTFIKTFLKDLKDLLTNKIVWIIVGSIFIILIVFFVIRRFHQEDEF
ncbi:hypothetical protein COV12_01295, partial [Candidatus Woesearchaeota archaeon CG10_big_fil_rev_8_21_14_0_10_32_24]